jgi:hypothetical protein
MKRNIDAQIGAGRGTRQRVMVVGGRWSGSHQPRPRALQRSHGCNAAGYQGRRVDRLSAVLMATRGGHSGGGSYRGEAELLVPRMNACISS